MGVKRLSDGRWIVYGRKGYFPEDPNRTREYFGRGATAEADAIKRDGELKNKKPRKTPPRTPGIIVKKLAMAYYEDRQSHMAQSTIDGLFYKFKVLMPHFGNLPAAAVKDSDITRYINKRLESGKKRTTIHRELADLKAVFSWAKRKGHLTVNPIETFELPKKDDAIILPPTDAEVKAILSQAAPHLIRAIYISAFTGLRPGQAELLYMQWHQVDWDREMITIISAKKGGAVSRKVPAHPLLFHKLRHWKTEDDKRWPEEKPDGPQEYIVHYHKNPSLKGQPVGSIKTAWKKAKERAKITRRLRPYDLRHAFATRLLEESADLKATSELLGHSRPDTTMRHYQHVTTALHRASIKKLDWDIDKED